MESDIPRACRGQFSKIEIDRFDVDTLPPAFVETLSDRVSYRIVGTYIDVEAVGHILEGVPDQNVLMVLRIAPEKFFHREVGLLRSNHCGIKADGRFLAM